MHSRTYMDIALRKSRDFRCLNSSILLDIRGNVFVSYSVFLVTFMAHNVSRQASDQLELPHRLPYKLHHRFHQYYLITTDK